MTKDELERKIVQEKQVFIALFDIAPNHIRLGFNLFELLFPEFKDKVDEVFGIYGMFVEIDFNRINSFQLGFVYKDNEVEV